MIIFYIMTENDLIWLITINFSIRMIIITKAKILLLFSPFSDIINYNLFITVFSQSNIRKFSSAPRGGKLLFWYYLILLTLKLALTPFLIIYFFKRFCDFYLIIK